jgi:hypothetical protein
VSNLSPKIERLGARRNDAAPAPRNSDRVAVMVVELGEHHLAVDIDEGLLIDAARALHVADIEGDDAATTRGAGAAGRVRAR